MDSVNFYIDKYRDYIKSNGKPDMSELFDLNVFVLVGYFLTEYKRDPISALLKCGKDKYLSFSKSRKVEILLRSLLNESRCCHIGTCYR